MLGTLKDKITNIIGIIVVIGTIVTTALTSVPEDAQWYVWVGAVVIGILSWATGKDSDLKAKKSAL